MIEQRFPIGTKFTPKRKHAAECTVVDVYRTYNSAGELVKLRYVTQHQFLGQTLTNYDVVDATIAIALGTQRTEK